MRNKVKEIRKVALLSLGMSILMTGFTSHVGYTTLKNSIKYEQSISHTHEVISKINETEKLITIAESNQRSFLYTNSKIYYDPYIKYTGPGVDNNLIVKSLGELKILTKDNEVQVDNLKNLSPLITQRLQQMDDVVDLHLAGNKKEAKDKVLTGVGKTTMDAAHSVFDLMITEENHKLMERQKIEKENSDNVLGVYLLLGVLNNLILFGSLAAVYFKLRLNEEV